MKKMKRLQIIATFILLAIGITYAVNSHAKERKHILVITSYNPDTQKMYTTLSDFTEELKKLDKGKDIVVDIENMNCKGLSEAHEWKRKMADILNSHKKSTPNLIITLGQEAWASFLSQQSNMAKHTPVMPALVSSNTIILNNYDSYNIRTCMPRSIYRTELKDFNIAGGIFYQYDIEKNLEITKKLFPQTKRILLITDFTLGGLAMQSHVLDVMKKHPDIRIVLLDGRSNTLLNICTQLKNTQKENTVIWIGTWRIDSSENYNITSTCDVLQRANPAIPAFSLSSVGMGNWSIAGHLPVYTAQGESLAELAYNYLSGKGNREKFTVTLPSVYSFDHTKLIAFGKRDVELPPDAIVLNTPADFFETHKATILTILSIIIVLSTGLLAAIYYIIKIRRLKSSLEVQSAELKKAKDEAEKANNVKTSFIANMSHEIRTPLNAIVGFANLMSEDDYDKEDRQQFSHIIQENSNLLLNLINDILDISKIESGKQPICWEKCDIIDLCRTSILSVKQARCLENVEFLEDFNGNETLTIDTDPSRLRQVIINLLTNASKFTKKGFIKLSINTDSDNNTVTFAVTDTGIGIPKEKADEVFERFVKLNQYVQGTGLGLSLCKVIIESLSGRIWVDTTYEEGARFIFTHPINSRKTGGVKTQVAYYSNNNNHKQQ